MACVTWCLVIVGIHPSLGNAFTKECFSLISLILEACRGYWLLLPAHYWHGETLMWEVQLCAVHTGTVCLYDFAFHGFHPYFKGGVYHFIEICHCSPCSQQRNVNAFLWKVLILDLTASGEQPNLAELWYGREGGRGLAAVPASLCLVILKSYCRMCKEKCITRSNYLYCCQTTSFTEVILQSIFLCVV